MSVRCANSAFSGGNILTHLITPQTAFHVGKLLEVTQSYSISVLIVGAVLSLLTGSVLEAISYALFGQLKSKDFFGGLLQGEFGKALMSSKEASLPTSLKPGGKTMTEEQSKAILEYWEAYVYENGKENTIATVQESGVALTFTANFILAFPWTLSSALWAYARHNYTVVLLVLVVLVMGSLYLRWDHKGLRSIYWTKILRAALAIK